MLTHFAPHHVLRQKAEYFDRKGREAENCDVDGEGGALEDSDVNRS